MQVLPVYCFDPRHYITTPWGNPKTGNYRAQFLLQSVLDLKQSLRSIDSDLLVKFGQPEDILPGEKCTYLPIITQPPVLLVEVCWLAICGTRGFRQI